MSFWEFLVYAFTAGPAVAMPYGLQMMPWDEVLVSLILCYSLPMPLIFYLFRFFEKREDYKNRYVNRLMSLSKKEARSFARKMKNVMNSFLKNYGELGYEISLAFLAFAFGFIWAALVAYLLRLPKLRATFTIFAGVMAGLIFWYLVIKYSLHFLQPTTVTAVMLACAGIFFVYGYIRETSVLWKIGCKVGICKETQRM
jgi:uncharacterized membrane protein